MNASVDSQKTRRKMHESINESKLGKSCRSVWIKQLWNTSHSQWPELYFLLKVQNNIKIKVTRHRVIGDGWIWEGISLMNPCWVSQSVIEQVLNASYGVFERKSLMEKLYFIVESEKLCYYKWKTW